MRRIDLDHFLEIWGFRGSLSKGEPFGKPINHVKVNFLMGKF
jgi:hypothetical protein